MTIGRVAYGPGVGGGRAIGPFVNGQESKEAVRISPRPQNVRIHRQEPRIKKFYIAGDIREKDLIAELAAALREKGLEPAYEWWVSLTTNKSLTERRIAAGKEITGVLSCDYFIGVLPGRRGSATELGAAVASHRLMLRPAKIVLWSPDDKTLNLRTNDANSANLFWNVAEAKVLVGGELIPTVLGELFPE